MLWLVLSRGGIMEIWTIIFFIVGGILGYYATRFLHLTGNAAA